MSTIHRNPEKIAEISRVWNDGYDDITRRLEHKYDGLRQKGDPATYADYIASQKKGTSERLFANLVKGMMDSEEVGKALNSMDWVVLDLSDATRPLMTSDRPIVLPHGLAHIDSVVEIAISPNHLFVGCRNKYHLEIILKNNSKDRIVGAHNDAVCKQAKDYVYAVDHSLEKFVDNRLGKFSTQFIGWIPGQYQKPDGWDDVLDRAGGRERKIRIGMNDHTKGRGR
jgi:hypothetical protein